MRHDTIASFLQKKKFGQNCLAARLQFMLPSILTWRRPMDEKWSTMGWNARNSVKNRWTVRRYGLSLT